jgi:signal transduction histidine kinase
LQIIDVNDKILYNEAKAEKRFLTLINAAISHELRNPLNSLMGQIMKMKQFYYKLDLLKNMTNE